MAQEFKNPKYIIVLGTTFSGSGAIFDYLNGRENPSVAAVIDPRKTKDSYDKFYWGSEPILIPIINEIDRGLKKFSNIKKNVSLKLK